MSNITKKKGKKMKNIVLFLIMFCSVNVYSQQTIDTLHLNINDRDSIYYYGCWIDGNENYNPATTKLQFQIGYLDIPRINAKP